MIATSKAEPDELHLLQNEDDPENIDFKYHKSRRPRWGVLILFLNTVLLAVNLVFLSSIIPSINSQPSSDSENLIVEQGSANAVLRQVSSYTPLLDKLNFTFINKKINGSLFNDPWSVYKAEPSEEVDAAWEEISKIRALVVEPDEIRKMGKDPEFAVQVPLEWGYGPTKYFAELDSQHLLHCLNTVRKYSHYSHYFYPKWGDESNMPALAVAHRSHCIGILLDALTCQPSLNLLHFNWMETQENPFPDFGINRKCVDHTAVLEWQDRVGINQDLVVDAKIEKPEHAKVIPALPQLLELGNGEGIVM